jgi:hypothetical protein
MANQIREGRARAAITEEGARQAPLETQSKRMALEEQPKIYERAAAQEGRAEAQAGRTETKDKLDIAGKRLDVIKRTLAQTTSPESYQKATQWLTEQGIAPEGGIDELPPKAQTPEGFMDYRDNVLIPELGVKKQELESRIQSYKTQEKVANIYANARKQGDNYDDLDGQDYRLIEQDLRQEYEDRYMEWVVEDMEEIQKKKPGAPDWNEETANKLFREKVKRIKSGKNVGRQSTGAKPKLDY